MINIKEILQNHKIWLDSIGAEGERADFTNTSLEGVNLEGANLRGAKLSYAILAHANLYGANLEGANLHCAKLTHANLCFATLNHAILTHANLHCANLEGANLHCANLNHAILTHANLQSTTLHGTSICDNKDIISASAGDYIMYCYRTSDQAEIRFTVGCRKSLTYEECLARWAADNKHVWTEMTPEWGERKLRQVEYLYSEAKHLGWVK